MSVQQDLSSVRAESFPEYRASEQTENFGGQVNYARRLTRVTSYIYDHLDDDLELQSLAEVAALSPYHWYRIYHAIYG